MWLLTIEDDEGSTVYHRLAGDRCTLGRAPDRDVVLTHFDVSRRHARLEQRDGAWLVFDEGSENGSYVNGYLVEGPTPFGPHDRVQIGDYRVSLSGGHQTGLLTPAPRYVLPARLRVLAGVGAGTELSFGPSESLTLGRGDECDLRLLHEAVTNVHALVRPLGGGRHEIVDKSGRGLFVNRRTLACKVLEGGDAINVAGVALLRYLEPSQLPDPRFDRPFGDDQPAPEGVLSRPSAEFDLEGDKTDEVECYTGVPPSSWKLRAAPEWLEGPAPLLPDERFEAAGPVPIDPLGAEPAGFARMRRATMLRGNGGGSSGRLPAASAVPPDEGAADPFFSRSPGAAAAERGAGAPAAPPSSPWPEAPPAAREVAEGGGLDDELGQWLSEAASQWAAASESAGEARGPDETPLATPSMRVPSPSPSGRSLAAYEAPAGEVDEAGEAGEFDETGAVASAPGPAPAAAPARTPGRPAVPRRALLGALGVALVAAVAWGVSSLGTRPTVPAGKAARGETAGATKAIGAPGAAKAPFAATGAAAASAAKAATAAAPGANGGAAKAGAAPPDAPAAAEKINAASPPGAPAAKGSPAAAPTPEAPAGRAAAPVRAAEGAGGRAGAARASAGATMEDAEARRARLAARARSGQASANELRTLLSLCRSSGDTGCVAESLARLKRAEGGP